MIYYCEICNKYYTEKDLVEIRELICGDEHGILYDSELVCPKCGCSVEEAEIDEEEICDLLNVRR